MRRLAFATLLIVLIPGGVATAQEWRFFHGGTGTRWRAAHGIHGHTEDCRTAACDDSDWERGNLDSSIGYRVGAERQWLGTDRLHAITGVDLSVVATEFNLSQRDLWVFIPSFVAGVETRYGRGALGVLTGVGSAWTDDGRTRPARSAEIRVDLLTNDEGGIRLNVRQSRIGPVRLRERGVLVHVRGAGQAGASRWDCELFAGASRPGRGPGRSLDLGNAPLHKYGLHRIRGGGAQRIGLTFTASAHESRRRTDFLGTGGNLRGKTIPSVGITWDRRFDLGPLVILRAGGGVEVADWSDPHELLVDGAASLEAGIAAAAVATVSASVPITPAVRLIVGVDQLHWLGTGLAERRVILGAGLSL
ncbi:MAG TPA: hypothetical protein VMS56_09145 [Thermoanaerobaculia bacterium]|nr:hypothetical protein [Thermoanaerobaculia bacterium]